MVFRKYFDKFLFLISFILFINTIVLGQYKYDTNTATERKKIIWPEGKRAAISFTFDDARLSQMDVDIPIFDRYGIKATFYVSIPSVKKWLYGWKKAVANGHEIGNHLLTHPCTGNFPFSRHNPLENFTLKMMEYELDEANVTIEHLLGVKPTNFAYPCGQKFVGRGRLLRSYVPLVAERFISGRGWLDEAANDPAFCDMAQILGRESDGLDFDQLKQLVDKAAEDGTWLVLAGHEIGPSGHRQTTVASTIEAFCKYAQEPGSGLWVATVQDVAEYILKQRGRRKIREKPVYLNPDKSINSRVEDLLSRMTLKEKIGQMNMPCVYKNELGKDIQSKMDGCRKFAEGILEEGIGPGGGFFTLSNTILHNGTRQQVTFLNELQKIAVEKTRLKIPLIEVEEGTHGLMCSGGTIFPEGLAIGSTWNMDLVGKIYSIAAREGRAIGIHQLFTLVIEPNRDPRLGRNQEGYSEDPYLCSQIAKSIVEGVQGNDISADDKVIAGFCHYPGQSEPVSGLERGAMEISERKLREVFLPPWVAAIKEGGALGVMATYPTINDVPVHASKKILTKILREELGFKGLVLGEGGGITTLVYENSASTQKKAGELAIKAGLDVGISYEPGYMRPMIENVREGKVSMALIDRSVRRILRIKFQLGLFENPYVDPERAVKVVHTEENQEIALQTAREGIVLLKNDNNLLPLDKNIKSIAVIGPNANHERNLLGDYIANNILQDIVTIYDGIRSKVSPGTEVKYIKGCNVIGNDLNEIKEASEIAKNSDLAIVVVGENERKAKDGKGTNGEGRDIASLDLTGLQEELVKAVFETGTPTVVVLINGRPLSIRWIAEHIPAILEPWLPGEQGGNAVADVLFGDYNPSGRLPITVPRHVGQLPVYYNYKPSKAFWVNVLGRDYVDMPAEPLYEFGFGLSYTKFEYSNLHITPTEIGPAGDVYISLDVKNTGEREGEEVVQLYINDVVSSVSTPVKELKRFEKIKLYSGEKKRVKFKLTSEHLSLFDRNMQSVVEPGTFDIMIGSSSGDIRLKGSFDVKD